MPARPDASGEIYIGLISGTSRDGVDAAAVRFSPSAPELLSAHCLPYPAELERKLAAIVGTARRPEDGAMSELDTLLAEHFADAVLALLERADLEAAEVTAVGSHGQTVWHDPRGTPPETIQLGSPGLIAHRCGILTVGDFRQADLRAGGEAAPLAPLLHRDLFSSDSESRAVLNLGGIANLTVLRPGNQVSGFDTGPANCLMDAWIQRERGVPIDDGGRWAASGRVLEPLLERLLRDSWFAAPPPKSTGIEYFNLRWLSPHLDGLRAASADIQATLAELTARTVANALLRVMTTLPHDLLLCGGGVHNPFLVERIRTCLPGVAVSDTGQHGLHPDWVEATLFAWLARERLSDRKQDTRSITGASEPVLLGDVYRP